MSCGCLYGITSASCTPNVWSAPAPYHHAATGIDEYYAHFRVEQPTGAAQSGAGCRADCPRDDAQRESGLAPRWIIQNSFRGGPVNSRRSVIKHKQIECPGQRRITFRVTLVWPTDTTNLSLKHSRPECQQYPMRVDGPRFLLHLCAIADASPCQRLLSNALPSAPVVPHKKPSSASLSATSVSSSA